MKTKISFLILAALFVTAKLTAQAVGDDTDIIWKFKPINKTIARNSVFTPDSKILIVGHNDLVLRFYDVETAEIVREIAGQYVPTFSRDGKLLAVRSDTSITVYNYPSMELYRYIKTYLVNPWSYDTRMSFSTDAKHLATAERDSGIYIWDLETGKGEKKYLIFMVSVLPIQKTAQNCFSQHFTTRVFMTLKQKHTRDLGSTASVLYILLITNILPSKTTEIPTA